MRGKITKKSRHFHRQSAPRSRKATQLGRPREDRTGERPYDLWRSLVAELLSNENLERIVQVTEVPEKFQHHARMGIDRAVHLLDSREWRPDERRRRLVKASFERLASLSQELNKAIEEIADQLGQSSILLSFEWSDREDDNGAFDHVDLMSLLCDFTDHCEQMAAPSRKHPPHRPRGRVQSPELRFLIRELYKSIVNEGHGKLTLWQDADGELKGKLPAVLKVLHDSLPGKVPATPPYTTLRRFLSEAASDGP
jgi:hypothetical protein